MALKVSDDKLDALGFDSTLAEAPVKVALVYAGSFEAGKGDLELSVEPQGQFGVTVFTKAKQKDSDQLLGQRPQDDQLSTQIKPQIDFDPHHAWIKYRASMGLKGGAQASPGAATLKLKAGKTFSFLDYRRHSPEDKLVETVKADVHDFRLALNLEDVLKLEPGDALAYRVEGELGGSVGLQWAEIFSANVEGLSSFAEASGLLSFSIPVNASVSFKYSVEDEFIVVFSRDVEDHSLFRVAVRKANRSSRSAGGGLSVKIGFANPKLVEESILETLLPGRIGQSVDLIDEVLDKASLEDLTKRQLALVREAFKRVGLDSAFNTIREARKRWKDLKSEFTKVVRKVANFRVEQGITYNYLRVDTRSSLLQVLLSEDQVKRFHEDLLARNLTPLVDQIRQKPDNFKLEDYLLEDKVERTQSLGFSLGIGPWTASGKDTLKETQVKQTDIEGRIRLTYAGMRSYLAKELAGEKFSYTVDFNAQMPKFCQTASPTADEFDYGLAIDWSWDESRGLSLRELKEILDAAVVWNVIDQGRAAEIEKQLSDDAGRGEEAKVLLGLKFGAQPFLRLLAPLRKNFAENEDLIFDCLGRAMPYWPDYEGRRDVKIRGQLYAPLWKDYFRNPDLAVSTLAQQAAREIEDHDRDLAFFEKTPQGGGEGGGNNRTFAMVAHNNGKKTNERWQDFREGVKTLQKAIADKRSHREIEEAFEDMVRFWNQPFFVRTLGNYLVRVADDFADIGPKVGRTLSVTVKGQCHTYSQVQTGGS